MNTMAFTTFAPMLPAKTAFRHVPIASFYRWITLRIEAFMIGTITRIVVRGRIIASGDGTSDTTICTELEHTGTENREFHMALVTGMIKTISGPGPHNGGAFMRTVGAVTLVEIAESGMIIHLDVLAR